MIPKVHKHEATFMIRMVYVGGSAEHTSISLTRPAVAAQLGREDGWRGVFPSSTRV
jgi:hypothetical protein